MKKAAAVFFLIIASVGCTTTIAYRPFDLDKSPFSALKGRTVAVVVEPARVPNEISTQSETQTFDFKGMAVAIREGLKSQAEISGAKVEVVEQMPKAGFDFYIRPQLEVRSVYDFWTYGCLAVYKVEVLGKTQNLIASANAEAKRNFMFTGQAEEKCNSALRNLVNDINEKAFSRISR